MSAPDPVAYVRALTERRAVLMAEVERIDAELELLRQMLGLSNDAAPAGHQASAILRTLRETGAPMRLADIIKATGLPANSIGSVVHKLATTGKLRRVERGVYALPEVSP